MRIAQPTSHSLRPELSLSYLGVKVCSRRQCRGRSATLDILLACRCCRLAMMCRRLPGAQHNEENTVQEWKKFSTLDKQSCGSPELHYTLLTEQTRLITQHHSQILPDPSIKEHTENTSISLQHATFGVTVLETCTLHRRTPKSPLGPHHSRFVIYALAADIMTTMH